MEETKQVEDQSSVESAILTDLEESLIEDVDDPTLRDKLRQEISALRRRYDKPVTARRVSAWYSFLRENGLHDCIQMYMNANTKMKTVKAEDQTKPEAADFQVSVDWARLQSAMEDESFLLRMIEIVCDVDRDEAAEVGMKELGAAFRFFLPNCIVPIQGLIGIAPTAHFAIAASLDLTGSP